ncbi:protein TOPLESS-like isoform X4 [Carex littledalei]|uniref:Protein TOPLESS-like isoform X4 n=1 Tax=Carex littledalei TaxID=544730 RepID=A0A833QV22_9POAL|nr:protein TOPLESS-like isoform X4 [Carex littledalei]
MAGNQLRELVPNSRSMPLSRDLFLLVVMFLHEEGLHESAHSLERDSRAYFNLDYLEEKLLAGAWADAEWYVKGYFPDVQQNSHALGILFEINKQKYLETLFRNEPLKAVDILRNEIMPLVPSDEDENYRDLGLLLGLDQESRQNQLLERCGNLPSARSLLFMEIKTMVLECPDLQDKLNFPSIPPFRLRSLLSQSFDWQHHLCLSNHLNPVMTTLLEDHRCTQSGPAQDFQNDHLQTMQMPPEGPSRDRFAAGTSTSEEQSHGGNMDIISVFNESFVPAERLRFPRFFGSADETPIQYPPVSSETMQEKFRAFDELPRTVVMSLHQGSSVASMDYNPTQQTLLLVGATCGGISIWNLCSRVKIFHKDFQLWNNGPLSSSLLASLCNESGFFSVRRVLWNIDGHSFAVAYCKHLVQLYKFSNRTNATRALQINAHDGGLNDITFIRRNRQLFIATCGDDHTVKVWCARTGLILHTLRSHSTPVLSICSKSRGIWQRIISASRDGMFKLWNCGKSGPQLELRGPACSTVSVVYTAGTTRLFSCGTITDGIGESFLLQWNETRQCIMRRYIGLSQQRQGGLQFEVTNGSILAVGDDSSVKFWDVDYPDMIGSTDAGGGLTASPRISFNKSGSLLALSAEGNYIKVLASQRGQELLSSSVSEPTNYTQVAPIPQMDAAFHDNSRSPSEINETSDFLSLRLPGL